MKAGAKRFAVGLEGKKKRAKRRASS